MKTRLEQVLERCLRGRLVAVWGTPTRRLQRALGAYVWEAAGQVAVEKHYVVAGTDEDLEDFLLDEQSKPYGYVQDYLTFSDRGGELPFAWACAGVPVGRQTYFGQGVVDACENGYIESIGDFTSINSTASIHVNHQLNMTFVSDDIQSFFDGEHRALFQSKRKEDPAHPYADSKPRMTIGSDVYIGAQAFVNASRVSNIGDGAIIGSGAVVLSDVPPYAVVVGVPAMIKRYRFSPEEIETLLRVRWWAWSAEEINRNAELLMSPEAFFQQFGP